MALVAEARFLVSVHPVLCSYGTVSEASDANPLFEILVGLLSSVAVSGRPDGLPGKRRRRRRTSF